MPGDHSKDEQALSTANKRSREAVAAPSATQLSTAKKPRREGSTNSAGSTNTAGSAGSSNAGVGARRTKEIIFTSLVLRDGKDLLLNTRIAKAIIPQAIPLFYKQCL